MKPEELNAINNEIDHAFDHEAAVDDARETVVNHTPWFQLEKDWRPDPNHNLRANSIW